MPDAHLGYTLPIGAVVLTDNVVFPSYVGFDIGCGMCSLKTSFDRREVEAHGHQIYDRILQHIPVGYNHRSQALSWRLPPVTKRGEEVFYEKSGFKQLGTLGGGNHFIEIGYDEDDAVWITIHSGSRGVGHGIATYYMKLFSGSNKPKEGHYGMSLETQEAQDYLKDMQFSIEFALENRKRMMYLVVESIAYLLNHTVDLDMNTMINRTHNHAEVVKEGIIHRKGATHAEKGMLGVIPGNMRDGSFIVKGLGNPDSLSSSSHGAGRVLGRNQAKKTLDPVIFEDDMEGIVCQTLGRLDESPGAYKDIFEVMGDQRDLVEVLHYIKPIINVKG